MNDVYNPNEHLAYDPLLHHLGDEKSHKDEHYNFEDNSAKYQKEKEYENQEKLSRDKTNVMKEPTEEHIVGKKLHKRDKGGTEELPPHWEVRKTPEGLTYYANHHTKQTQWHHPLNNTNLSPIHHPHATNSHLSSSDYNAPVVNSDDLSSKRKIKSSTKLQYDDNGNIINHEALHTSSTGEHRGRKKKRSSSVTEIDAFVRILRTPPRRIKVGYTTMLFTSHPSLSLQVIPTAQAACDWLNTQRKMNFHIDNITINLNRSLIKGLHLWMTIYKDNSTKHSYDRTRKWCCKVFGLSSISMTLDPHMHGNSKTSKIMSDFLTWRAALPPNVPVIYTLSHSRTYSCVVAIYLSNSTRDQPNNTELLIYQSDVARDDFTNPRHKHHHHHRHHKDHPGHDVHHNDHGVHREIHSGEHHKDHNDHLSGEHHNKDHLSGEHHKDHNDHLSGEHHNKDHLSGEHHKDHNDHLSGDHNEHLGSDHKDSNINHNNLSSDHSKDSSIPHGNPVIPPKDHNNEGKKEISDLNKNNHGSEHKKSSPKRDLSGAQPVQELKKESHQDSGIKHQGDSNVNQGEKKDSKKKGEFDVDNLTVF